LSFQVTDGRRLLIEEALREIDAEPPPFEPGRYGVGMVLLGIADLVAVGALVPRFGIAGGVATTVLILGAGLTVTGLFLAMTRGGFTRGASIAATEAALRQLERGDEDEEVLLRAATLLLAHSVVSYGATTSNTFVREEAAARIGPQLPMVRAVEEVLLAEERIYPVFTLDAEDEPAH
jgi:hypothetical protein